MHRATLLLLVLCAAAAAAPPAVADVSRALHETGLDPDQCYRVRDLSFAKDDIRVYLNDGYVIFSKPVLGQRLSVVFTSDVEGGDGEVIVMPPTRSERQSLAGYTQSPNLDEHLRAALMLFTDGTAEQLLDRINREGLGKKAPEMGPVLAGDWTPVSINVAGTLEMRLVEDLLSPRSADTALAFFAMSGKTLGSFDVVSDARADHRIAIRQRSERDGRPTYSVWTSFPARSVRNGAPAQAPPDFKTPAFSIDATIDTDLRVIARTRATVRVGDRPDRVFPFEIASAMHVDAVRIDGAPAEMLRGDSARSRIAAHEGEDLFLVIAPDSLAPGTEHQFEFEHQGNVISTAGNGVYFVNARGGWYPHMSGDFATYDLTFHYPKALTLVSTGEPIDERVEGETRIVHRRTNVAVQAAGFNLGDYDKVSGTAAGVAFEVYGNRHIVEALRPKMVYVQQSSPAPTVAHYHPQPNLNTDPEPVLPSTPDPLGRFHVVAGDVSSALEFYTNAFGPPALKMLTVTPIPGTFGQGFPGLIYLSTFAYLDPLERPAALRSAQEEVFFSDLITAHEVAHQWWGSTVTINRAEDEWLLEALANYSSLLWIEKKRGSKESAKVLEGYRDELMAKPPDTGTPESAGPIVWGDRLKESAIPDAWRVITYGKGAWIMHMLRRRMGDERFFAMLSEMRRRFQLKALTTEDFHALAREYRPAGVSAEAIDAFFENWVYATGVPALKLRYSVKGAAPSFRISGTLAQSGVDDDFSVDVPVEIQFAKGAPQTVWVRTSGEDATFSATVRQAPLHVIIPDDVLMKK